VSVGVGDVAGHAEVIFQILENEKETKRLRLKFWKGNKQLFATLVDFIEKENKLFV
jgi:hypothetical protein